MGLWLLQKTENVVPKKRSPGIEFVDPRCVEHKQDRRRGLRDQPLDFRARIFFAGLESICVSGSSSGGAASCCCRCSRKQLTVEQGLLKTSQRPQRCLARRFLQESSRLEYIVARI